MKNKTIIAGIFSVAALLTSSTAENAKAWIHHGNSAPVGSLPPGTCSLSVVCTYWSGFSGATVLASTSFIPMGAFAQNPTSTTGYAGVHTNLAAAALSANFNGFIGMDGSGGNYPENAGSDSGELTAIKGQSMWLIAGGRDYTSSVTRNSAQNMNTTVTNGSFQQTWIGFEFGDEPPCGTNVSPPPAYMNQIPTAQSNAHGVNANVLYVSNMNNNVATEQFGFGTGCHSALLTALAALSYKSFDIYGMTNPYAVNGGITGVRMSDGVNYGNDMLFTNGMGIANLASYGSQPTWGYVDDGNDILGGSSAANFYSGQTTNTSTTLVNTGNNSFYSSIWVGLTVTDSGGCIPTSTTISSITDTTHAVMSHPATCTNSSDTITLTGGVHGGCILANNICPPYYNLYRNTTVITNGTAWDELISGATGLLWFLDDTTSFSFSLGDSAGGSAATTALANGTYIRGEVEHWAPVINQKPDGICQTIDAVTWVSTSNCSQGNLTVSSSVGASTIAARVDPYNGKEYLMAILNRHSAAGVTAAFAITGATGNAILCYDSRIQYDNGNKTAIGTTYAITSNSWSDTHFGDGGTANDDYDVKIYVTGGTCDF